MASFARTCSLFAATIALIGLAGAHFGLLAPLTGFVVCMVGALLGGLLSVILSLVGIATTRGRRDPGDRSKAWTGLAVGLGLILAVLAGWAGSGAAGVDREAASINDISTDLEDPPAFAPASVVPEYAGRDMAYPAEFAPIVRSGYPDLAPLVTDAPVDATFARALEVAEELGFEIVARNDPDHTFDAREATFLFRFVDDVVVRVRPEGSGSRVDVRSKSRDGRGDLGANAQRIRRFLDALRSAGSAS